MAVKYKVDNECDYLQDGFPGGEESVGKYPFQMIEFFEEGGKLLVHTLSERGAASHRKGSYPRAETVPLGPLSSSTAGNIANLIENASSAAQGDLIAAGIQRVELCYDGFSLDRHDDLPFAKKGTALRLPLLANLTRNICRCQCGTKYSHNLSASITTPILPPYTKVNVDLRSFFPGGTGKLQDRVEVGSAMQITCSKLIQKDVLLFESHQWFFGTGVYVTTRITDFVSNPKCPNIPMAVVSWVVGSVIFGSYVFTPSVITVPPETIWSITKIFSEAVIGPQIGVFCLVNDRVTFRTTSDATILNNSTPSLPAQPTISDYPESNIPPTCPPEFPPWEISVNSTLVETGSFQDCDADCECP